MVTPVFDYGDAPDVVAGTATGDYQTTALDQGAAHLLGVANAPFLGACVDADRGVGAERHGHRRRRQRLRRRCSAPAPRPATTRTASPSAGRSPVGTASLRSASPREAPPPACSTPGWTGTTTASSATRRGEQIATDLTVPDRPADGVASGRCRPARCPASPTRASAARRPRGVGPTGDRGRRRGRGLSRSASSVTTSATLRRATARRALARRATSSIRTPRVYLGACVDTEPDGQPDAAAARRRRERRHLARRRVLRRRGRRHLRRAVHRLPERHSHRHLARRGASSTRGSTGTRDGDFDDAGERIADRRSGDRRDPASRSVTVPCTALNGVTYARFRLSSNGVGHHRPGRQRRGRGLRGDRRTGRLRRRAGFVRHAAGEFRAPSRRGRRLLARRDGGQRERRAALGRRHRRRRRRRRRDGAGDARCRARRSTCR